MATVASNKIKYLIALGLVDFSTDVFKIVLMESGFVYDIETHDVYGDISDRELATGNGYTAGGQVLAGVAVTENPATDHTEITWNNVIWTATTGPIGPAAGAIIYDDSIASPSVKPIVGYLDFGGDQTQAAGGSATVSSVSVVFV